MNTIYAVHYTGENSPWASYDTIYKARKALLDRWLKENVWIENYKDEADKSDEFYNSLESLIKYNFIPGYGYIHEICAEVR